MQDHLHVMVLADQTFGSHSTTCTDIICYQHLILYVSSSFCNSILIAVEPPNNSHNSLALVQWLFRFLWRDSNPVENL